MYGHTNISRTHTNAHRLVYKWYTVVQLDMQHYYGDYATDHGGG